MSCKETGHRNESAPSTAPSIPSRVAFLLRNVQIPPAMHLVTIHLHTCWESAAGTTPTTQKAHLRDGPLGLVLGPEVGLWLEVARKPSHNIVVQVLR